MTTTRRRGWSTTTGTIPVYINKQPMNEITMLSLVCYRHDSPVSMERMSTNESSSDNAIERNDD
jgi:hypothetical protein